MNRKRAVYIGIGVGIIAAVLIGYGLIPRDDFSTKNSYWNGLSKLESRHEVDELSQVKRLQEYNLLESDSALLIVGPNKDFTGRESREIEDFVDKGGRVILADDFGSGNDLLTELGTDIRFSGSLLVDPMFKTKNLKMPTIPDLNSSTLTRGLSSIAFNYGTILTDTASGRVLASSSGFSYLTETESPVRGEDSPTGPFPVMTRMNWGSGDLVVISDSSPFINSMLGRENNGALIRNLVGDREVYLDVSHWERSNLVIFQNLITDLYEFVNRPEIKYGVLVLLIAIIFKFGWKGRKGTMEEKEEKAEIDEMIRRHPDWNRGQLERLKGEEGK